MTLILFVCPTPGQPVAPSSGMGESLASMLARITRPVMLALQSTPILYSYVMRRIGRGWWIAIWLWLRWICLRRVCWRRVCWRRICLRRICWRRGLIRWRWLGVCWRGRPCRRRIVRRGRGLISRRGRGPSRRRIVRRGRGLGGLLPLPDVGRREVLPPGHVGFGQGLRRARGAAREVDVHAYPLAGAVRHRQRRFRPCFGLNRLRNVAGSSPSI